MQLYERGQKNYPFWSEQDGEKEEESYYQFKNTDESKGRVVMVIIS